MMNAIKKFGMVALVLTALTGMIPITANAAGDDGGGVQRTISATLDKGEVNYMEGETASVTFTFSNTFMESSQPGYIFLVPLDEATSNLVEITSQDERWHSSDVRIWPGDTIASSQATLRLKDGYAGATMRFGIEVRSDNDNTQDNIISAWAGGQFSINVDNVMPQVESIEIDGRTVRNGEMFAGTVLAGTQKTFSVGISDPGIEYFGVQGFDFVDSDKAYTQLTFKENGVVVETKIIPGLPTGQTVTHRFMSPGTAQVTAKARDKDMTDQEFADAPEFTVNVVVGEAPAIILSPYSGSTIFNETDSGPSAGRVEVGLTVAPSGLVSGNSITVVLEVSRNGLDDGPLPVLNTYEIPFKNGQTMGYFYFKELDGTPQSASQGFRIHAYIKETTPCAYDPSKTWHELYAPVDDFDIFVQNVAPQIGPGGPNTFEIFASLNVPIRQMWKVWDVASDQKNMKVTWSYDGVSQTTIQSTTDTYSKEITFTRIGSKVVTLTVEDKDGGTDTRSWYYLVTGPEGETEEQRESEEKDGYTWTYTVVNGEAIINNYGFAAVSPDPVGQLIIPSELGGCPVGGIAFNAFERCTNLTAVTFPANLKSIGMDAFSGCSGLTSVTIPSSVMSIGSSAFKYCSGLTSVTIPSSVMSIGSSAFKYCSGLTSVVLPSCVTNIGYYAFDDCERLSTVYVEKGDAARVRGLLEGSRSYLDWDSISFVEDWVQVDETVILTSAEIEAEMVKYPALAALAGGDVEAFAKLPSAAGKVDAAGNQMHVWQDLVAGTDPTDPDDLFKVTSIAMENGEIKVTWSPDLNENGTKNVRRYIQYGCKTIGDTAAWVDLSTVPVAEQNDYKFRKVTVGMP